MCALPVVSISESSPDHILYRKKQYKKQLKAWGYEKNIKRHEMLAMLQIVKWRLDKEGKKTKFMRRGRDVSDDKLTRFKKRHNISDGDELDLPPDERRKHLIALCSLTSADQCS